MDYCDWNAVSAENNFRTCGICESGQSLVYLLDQRLQVHLVTIEGINALHRDVFSKQPSPLVETAARGRARILWIKRKQHNLVAAGVPKLFDRHRRKRMPVPHGHKTTRVQTRFRQLQLQGPGLLLGESANRRASANGCVMMLDFSGASAGNKLG